MIFGGRAFDEKISWRKHMEEHGFKPHKACQHIYIMRSGDDETHYDIDNKKGTTST